MNRQYLFTFFYVESGQPGRVSRTEVVAESLKSAQSVAKNMRPDHDYLTYDVQWLNITSDSTAAQYGIIT
jgi:hypothetical protein